jgi:hypothetical protein
MITVRGIWTVFAGIISAIIGYRMGTRSHNIDVDQTAIETSQHIDAWNSYIVTLRELSNARLSQGGASASPDGVPVAVTISFGAATDAAVKLADSIGNHFGAVAKEALRNLFREQVQMFDSVFSKLVESNDIDGDVHNLYDSGKRLAEYLNGLSGLFRYHELADMIKILFDRVLRMPIDRKKSGFEYETRDIDVLMDHTSALSNYFATTLIKIDNLRSIIRISN